MFYVLYMMLFVQHASEGMASFLIIKISTLMEIGIVPSHCIPLHLAISYEWNSLDLHKIAFEIRQTNYPNKWMKKKRKTVAHPESLKSNCNLYVLMPCTRCMYRFDVVVLQHHSLSRKSSLIRWDI